MARMLPKKDVVIMGLGWTGSILGEQLTAAGLNVVAIERGPWRDTATDFNIGYMQDELRYAIRKDLFLSPAVEAMTMRNNASQTALPMRDYGSFLPGNGVGGAGVHWNGHTWRFWEYDFRIKSHITERYGAAKLKNLMLQDWGPSWAEIEPHFDKFEYLCGVSGKAGNLKGQIQPGGNPFESPRVARISQSADADALCLDPVRGKDGGAGLSSLPAAVIQPVPGLYQSAGRAHGRVQLLRLLRALCLRQLFQGQRPDHHPAGADAAAQFRAAHRMRGAEGQSHARRQDGARASPISTRTAWRSEQPGDLVILCGYGLMNVRMMLLSKIGTAI